MDNPKLAQEKGDCLQAESAEALGDLLANAILDAYLNRAPWFKDDESYRHHRQMHGYPGKYYDNGRTYDANAIMQDQEYQTEEDRQLLTKTPDSAGWQYSQKLVEKYITCLMWRGPGYYLPWHALGEEWELILNEARELAEADEMLDHNRDSMQSCIEEGDFNGANYYDTQFERAWDEEHSRRSEVVRLLVASNFDFIEEAEDVTSE
mgnify:CR=1 FL=1